MSENPYQPSQVAQKTSGQSIGLRRIMAISSAYNAQFYNWKFYGFLRQALIWLLIPLVIWWATYSFLLHWIFPDQSLNFWLMAATAAPWHIFILLSSMRVITSPRTSDQTPYLAGVNSDGILFVSGWIRLKESAANNNRIHRFFNRLMTGFSFVQLFIRIPCKVIQAVEAPAIALSRRLDPLNDEQEAYPEDDIKYWYAAGKLDPQKEPELVYQHFGFNSDPAVKIHYLDEQQRSMWLVLASPDADYLQRTLATLPQSFMITLGR